MPEMSIPTTFSIDFISKLEKINEFTSKVRARIYYKGGNRNGTWITDEFAERLNLSIPHVPIVGTYNPETDDFEDHEDNGNKKAYGFVPSEYNPNWEVGPDGKEYFSVDVILWTSYWPEAAKIINKSQSMELAKESIMGDWKVIAGDYYFVYQNGAFKGLCTLGDITLPCFEESVFYTLDKESRSFFQSINKINENNLGGGNEEMEVNSEQNKPEINTENTVEDVINNTTVVDNTAVVEEVVENTVVNEEETINQEVVEDVVENITLPNIEEQYQSALQSIETLNSEIARFQAQVDELNTQIESYKAQLDELQSYKSIFIKNEKLEIVEQFKKRLSEDEIAEFVENIDNYTAEELKTKLSIIIAEKVLKEENTNPNQNQFVRIPERQQESGISSILKKYKKN